MDESTQLVRDLFSFSNRLHQKIAQSHHAHSTYVGRGRILYLLAQNDYVYQNQLAKLAKVKPGSLTQILEKMEKEGLIIRCRARNDRRLVYVRLSPAGKEQFVKNCHYHQDFQQFITAPLSKAEMEQFNATLAKLRQRLDEYLQLHQQKGDEKK